MKLIAEIARVDFGDSRGTPREFFWRGQRHRVRSINKVRRINQRVWAGVEQRLSYELHTTGGLRCTLEHDCTRGIWRVVRELKGRGNQKWTWV